MDATEKITAKLMLLLKDARLECGMSHEELAVAAKLNRSTISLYESGQRTPSVTSALRVAHALDLSLAELLAKVE
jgi:transcriptional regulator with XRE-family HTH domain